MSIVDFLVCVLIISRRKTWREKIPSWTDFARDHFSMFTDIFLLYLFYDSLISNSSVYLAWESVRFFYTCLDFLSRPLKFNAILMLLSSSESD